MPYVGVKPTSDQLRAFNMSKSKSAGDLIAELKAHSGVASLRKVGLGSAKSSPTNSCVDEQPQSAEFKLVALRHVNTTLP